MYRLTLNCEAVLYSCEEAGDIGAMVSSSNAVETAASRFLHVLPDEPCTVTDVFAYYAHGEAVEGDGAAVRPVWAIVFANGRFAVTVDGMTGELLDEYLQVPGE